MAIDEKKLNSEFVFSSHGTAPEVMADLDRCGGLEAHGKQRVKIVQWSALGAFLLMLVLTVVISVGFIVLAFVIPIGILIYSAILSRRAIIPERVAFLRLLLQTLSHDAGQKGRFKIMMRLRKSLSKVKDQPNPIRKAETMGFFYDSWLTLDGRLSEGTALHTACTDLIRIRSRRNARGKTKSKERRTCLLRVQLDCNPSTYADAKLIAAKIPEPFRLPQGAALKARKFTEKTLAMKASVRGDLTPANMHNTVAALLLGAYRILNAARRDRSAVGGRP